MLGHSRTQGCVRRGATVVEFALVAPLVMLLLLGFAVLAVGVYRYQEIAYLAREGARYASTHGAQYRADNRLSAGNSTVWTQEIRDTAVLPKASALDPEYLTATANWSAGSNWANAGDASTSFSSTVKNTVTVTVTYQWFPESFWIGPVTLQSSATAPTAY